jgi:MarR family
MRCALLTCRYLDPPGTQLITASCGPDVGAEACAVRLEEVGVPAGYQWQFADLQMRLVATDVLLLVAQLVEAIQEGLARRGFRDVRPAHRFAFARQGDATIADVADHLGVSKQAAAQLVRQLEERGYVRRQAHPFDARAALLALTQRGIACTLAAQDSPSETVEGWRTTLWDNGSGNSSKRWRGSCRDRSGPAGEAPPGRHRHPSDQRRSRPSQSV